MSIKQIQFKNSKDEQLVGELHLPRKETDSAVIVSHGFAANKDRERLVKLANKLSNDGFAAFRFDFGGCGESQDREITVGDQVDDLKSAIEYLREEGCVKIGLVGESLGGLTSIIAWDQEVVTLVLWAPVTRSKAPSLIQDKELKQQLDEKGILIFNKKGRSYIIPKKYLEERQAVEQKRLLSKIKSPVLIIHGDQDKTISLKDSKTAIRWLPKESKLKVIRNGGHKLDNRMDIVIPTTVDWFRKYLCRFKQS